MSLSRQKHKKLRTYFPGLKPTTPVFGVVKAVSAFDRKTFVIGLFKYMVFIVIAGFVP
jgi:hypothetical protein